MNKRFVYASLMYIPSRNITFIKVSKLLTCSVDTIVFKLPTNVSPVHKRSPYHIGTKLLNELA